MSSLQELLNKFQFLTNAATAAADALGMPPGSGVDDARDAFRHAYISAETTRLFGSDAARILGDLNELKADLAGTQSAAAKNMDLFNNEVGRALGDVSTSAEDSAQRAFDAFNNGGLITDLSDGRQSSGSLLDQLLAQFSDNMAGLMGAISGALGPLGACLPPGNPFPSGEGQSSGACAGAIAGLFGRSLIDPIVFDLSGNGIELTSLANSNAYFDLNNDSFADHTGWVGPQTGLLVQDNNSNGVVDNITELFGNSSTDGFTAMKALDGNSDNVLDSNDAGFSGLKIWTDTDGDGTTDSGELHTLAELNIASISLNSSVVDETVNGNLIGAVATFTRTDQSTGQVAEAYFDNSQMDSQYTGEYEIDPQVLFLPNMRGYGTLPDLFIAMSQDSTLLQMVQDLSDDSIEDGADFDEQVKNIIYRWAGVDEVSSDSRGIYVNAQNLGVLEKFVGQDYLDQHNSADPQTSVQGGNLAKAWDSLFAAIKIRLLVQGPLASFLPDVGFDSDTDGLVGSADFSSLVESIGEASPESQAQAIKYWTGIVPLIDGLAQELGVSSEEYDEDLEAAFSEANSLVNLPITLDEIRNNGVFLGGDGYDILTSTGNGPHYFDGMGGDDKLTGDAGDNIYVFGRGYGHDLINNIHLGSGQSVLKFNTDTAPEDVIVTRSGDDLILSIASTSDQVTVQAFFSSSYCHLAAVQFSDETSWDYQALLTIVTTGTSGDDTLLGDGGDNTLDGGAGNDALTGNGGNDIYYFGRGYGQDTINNVHTDNGQSVLRFNSDVAPADVVVSRHNDDLVLTISGTTDKVTVLGYFSSPNLRVSAVQFSDNTSWDYQTLFALVLTGTSGNDILVGDSSDNTLDGGAGNDTLTGNGGNDTYVFGRGYGHDTVNNYHTDAGVSVLQFKSDTAPGDVLLSRSGDDLTLSIAGTTDSVTVQNYFYLSSCRVNTIQFTGGTSWDYAAVCAKFLTGTAGNDTLSGTSGNNTLDGLAGNDTLTGNGGNDTYVFGRGYGQDTINNTHTGNGQSVLVFNSDTAPADVVVTRSGYHLVIAIAGTSDQVTVQNYFYGSSYNLAAVQFSDGTSWNYQTVIGIVTTGTPGNDTLIGTAGIEVLDGGAGNDTLKGDGGNDTYIYGRSYGQDTIQAIHTSGQPILNFNSDLAPADMLLTKTTNSDLVMTVAGTTDKVTLQSYFYGSYYQVASINFDGGTSWTPQNISAFYLGTTSNNTLTGNSSDNTFYSSPGTDTMVGNGGYDTYKIGSNVGSTTINNLASDGVQTARGKVDFSSDLNFESLWFQQNGNDLKITELGTTEAITVSGWFGANERAKVESFNTSDGYHLDSQVSQLVSAMATYAANNPGFNPTTTQMPTDSTLQTAIAAAWHQ
ncbi:MAG: calcium-binding protein [Alphaproteobacteria bacterium]|nr:calcium-binding protein [Alphaproteobacteria bacterium]